MHQATDRPADTDAAVDQLLGWAGRAPSVHNTQPWTWRVRGTRVDLHADFHPPAVGAETLALLESRITDRRRLSSWPVPADRLNSLAMTGSAWGAQVLPVEQEATRSRLERLTRQADLLQRRNPRYIDELDAWVVRSGDQGVPAGHVPRSDLDEDTGKAGETPNRRFPHGVLEDPVLDSEPPADACC